jgi:molybdopterin synthase catalytic subunit
VFEITEQPIEIKELTDAVADSKAGAIATFIGTTREHNRGRNVVRLEYEAYADMAVAEFEKIAEEALAKWEISHVAISHRIGEVPIGEVSVAIAVSAPHRAEAIEACHFAIDRLKIVAPIWKKEYFEGGEVWIASLADCEHGSKHG